MITCEPRTTETGGRKASTRHIPPRLALAVGMPATPAPRGWQWAPLTSLAKLESGHTPSRRHPEYWGGSIPWIGIADAKSNNGKHIYDTLEKTNELGIDNSSARVLPENTVCLSRTASVGYVVVMGKSMATSQDFVNWVCTKQLYHEFLKYLFIAEGDGLLRFASGAVHQTIYFPEAKAFHICYPPLPEQRRIVRILDEAFEAIATAKANTEKNLQNARALFESHLNAVFTQRGKGWVDRSVGEIAKKSLGKMLDKAKNQGELRPYLRNLNVRWFEFDLSDLSEMRFLDSEAEKFTAVRGDVLICEGGYPGRAAIWDEDYSIHFQKAIHRVRFHEREHNKWFVYFLYAKDMSGELRRHFTGTGIQHFTGETLGRFQLPVPPLPQLRRLVLQFDKLAAETKRLESNCQRKLAALNELKKSLLHQAFTGQLTEGKEVIIATPSLPFPIELTGISTTDLHAGILAMAHQLHEEAGRLEHFGHVKAEKIAHMVEARLGISLGRKPVKDAAGPNDFNHLKKVEHRARMTNCFEFKRTDNAAYRVQKLRGFDRLIERTQTALGNRLEEVERLLQWMLPMNAQQAEIVATVYAAWNNLLLDGKNPTDEEIVLESRENWHPNKLKIPRDKFFSAVKWLREQGVVPTGKGTRVSANAK